MDVWQALREFVIFFLHQERRKLQERADEIAAGTTDKKYVPAAVYVIVSLRAMQAIDFGWLVNKGFAFHHYRAPGHGCTPLPEPSTDSNAEGTAEFVYYCWPGAPEEDMVPHNSRPSRGRPSPTPLTPHPQPHPDLNLNPGAALRDGHRRCHGFVLLNRRNGGAARLGAWRMVYSWWCRECRRVED